MVKNKKKKKKGTQLRKIQTTNVKKPYRTEKQWKEGGQIYA